MKPHRITLDLDDVAYKALKNLQRKSRSKTSAGVFRRALALYEMVVDAKAEGHTLLVDRGGKQQEVWIL